MRYLLDTNVCIAAMKNHAAVMQRLKSMSPADCAISTISSYELQTGVEKCADPTKELAKVQLLKSTITELAFDALAASEAARIRANLESKGNMIGPYDVLLAGHARAFGLILVTANTGEFGRVPGLSLENWQAP